MDTGAVKQASILGRKSTLRKAKHRKYMWAYVFILPQFVFFASFTLYPIVMSYIYVLYDWFGIGPLNQFVGLDNFRHVLKDANYWHSVRNSLIYMSGKIILEMPLSLLMAIFLNSVMLKGKTLLRILYFIPVVSTTAIIGVVMKFIFGNDNALVNNVLLRLGWIKESIPWLLQPVTAMIVLIIVGAWLNFGMPMIYWLASLQSLPRETYDAARTDGCNAWQSFRYVTVPLLFPYAAVILLLEVVSGFNAFDLAKTLTGGGPYFATTTVDMYVYTIVFSSPLPNIGYGSAAGMAFGWLVFLLTSLLAWITKKARGQTT